MARALLRPLAILLVPVAVSAACTPSSTERVPETEPAALLPEAEAVPAAAPAEGYAALDADARALVRDVVGGATLIELAPGGLDEAGGKPTHVEARLQRKGEVVVHKVRDCAAVFTELHDRTAQPVDSAAFRVDVSPFGASSGGRNLFSLAEACDDLLADGSAQRSDRITARLQLHSSVGPIVTLVETRSESRGGGPSYEGDRWLTFDVRVGTPAPLTALISEASLVEALKSDPYLRANLPTENFEALRASKTEAQAIEAAAPDLFITRAYAFVADRSKGKVAMRVAFRDYANGLDPNRVRTLGLWVEPTAEAKAWFDVK